MVKKIKLEKLLHCDTCNKAIAKAIIANDFNFCSERCLRAFLKGERKK